MDKLPDDVGLPELEEGEPPPPYADLSPKEVDQLIIRCRKAINSHRRDSRRCDPEAAAEFQSAEQSVLKILRDLLRSAPAEKRAKIEALLTR